MKFAKFTYEHSAITLLSKTLLVKLYCSKGWEIGQTDITSDDSTNIINLY